MLIKVKILWGEVPTVQVIKGRSVQSVEWGSPWFTFNGRDHNLEEYYGESQSSLRCTAYNSIFLPIKEAML